MLITINVDNNKYLYKFLNSTKISLIKNFSTPINFLLLRLNILQCQQKLSAILT